jgi:hypothetical protein
MGTESKPKPLLESRPNRRYVGGRRTDYTQPTLPPRGPVGNSAALPCKCSAPCRLVWSCAQWPCVRAVKRVIVRAFPHVGAVPVGLTQGHWVLRWQACANRWLQCLECMLDTFRTGDIDPLVCPVWIVHALNRTQTPVARYPGWHALRDLIDTLRPGPERCIRCYCAALWYASTTSDEIRPRSETFSPRLRAQPESPGLLAIDHSAPLRCGSCSTAGAARTGAAAGGRRPNGGRWKSKSASPSRSRPAFAVEDRSIS